MRASHHAGARTTTSLVPAGVPELTGALVRTIKDPDHRKGNAVSRHDLWRSCHDNPTRVLRPVSRGR